MHKPVLLKETMAALQPHSAGVYLDGTLGAGGHATAILRASAPSGRLFGFDQDPAALALAGPHLEEFGGRVRLYHANFDQMERLAKVDHIPAADGILLDLGVSSMQLDQPDRGFSFRDDAPLDMRMNPAAGQTAADLVNDLAQDDLANLIYRYGEERFSRRIARAIVKARPIQRTQTLADLVARVTPSAKGKRKIHPATKTFQALRIAVNDELGALERALPQTIRLLKPGGRLAVISFHSLEDRIAKQFFRQEAQDCICPPEHPICTCQHRATITVLTKKPVVSGPAEIQENPRARSAKLRVVELKRG